MDELFRLTTQFLHVFSAILWIGGGFYTLLVQLPALLAVPPQARGPAMAQLAPRQTTYLLRVAELTLVTGVLNIVASGRGQQLTDPLSSRWAIVLTLGILMAVGLYALIRAAVVPAVRRMLELGPKAAGGDASAGAEAGRLVERLKTLGWVQLALGTLIVLAMVTARLS